MKITKSILKQIIKEELEKINEVEVSPKTSEQLLLELKSFCETLEKILSKAIDDNTGIPLRDTLSKIRQIKEIGFKLQVREASKSKV